MIHIFGQGEGTCAVFIFHVHGRKSVVDYVEGFSCKEEINVRIRKN